MIEFIWLPWWSSRNGFCPVRPFVLPLPVVISLEWKKFDWEGNILAFEYLKQERKRCTGSQRKPYRGTVPIFGVGSRLFEKEGRGSSARKKKKEGREEFSPNF